MERKRTVSRSRPMLNISPPSTSATNFPYSSCDFTDFSESKVQKGQLNVLQHSYESLDYDTCENALLLDEERTKDISVVFKWNVVRWVLMALIGVVTALIACFIDIVVENLTNIKHRQLKHWVDYCVDNHNDCVVVPYLIWLLSNAGPVLLASILIVYIEPIAGGSGIPQVKCYLNGVKIPRIVRIRTLFAKVFSVILAVVGGLAAGKEGPMIHSGAIVAAGVTQGKSTTFSLDYFKIFKYFRNDREKRDFVAGGAAAGVSAAFGAPVGGVLFSLEEGASFWNQALTWRIFFCSIVSAVTLNVVLSYHHGVPGKLNHRGLLNFGIFERIDYELYEIPIFLVMGAAGGLLGAFYNHINYKITVFRIRHVYRRWNKVAEAVIVATTTATVGFLMILCLNDCEPIGKDPIKNPIQMYCNDGEYNVLGALWFQTPELSVRSFFHDPPESHQALSVFIFFIFYFLLSIWTYGISVSSGLFIPMLLTGAAWGRLVGMFLGNFLPDIEPGTYALIGAAAQLGGVVRMTISLTVILIEATGNIMFGLPLMLVLMMAKWVGDYFNNGIYDIHIQLAGVPILGWEPPVFTNNIYASEVMSHPVITLNLTSKVRHIYEILRSNNHHGFPVVEAVAKPYEDISRTFGRFRGLVLRSQLIVLLKNKIFNENTEDEDSVGITTDHFGDPYPSSPNLEVVDLTSHELEHTLDLRPYMNPAPYIVMHCASLPRIYRLFRALGLRHLVVINEFGEVVGMVTRKDLARYRFTSKMGRAEVQELSISKQPH